MKLIPRYFFLLFLCIFRQVPATAQIPVRQEPRHKMVLENDYIRLFDVHIAPGDTTLYHIHAMPSVVVIITKSTIGTQVYHKPPSRPGEVLPGSTSFIDYGTHPLTHRVWNQGSDTFHVMDIELLRKPSALDSCPVLYQPNLRFAWEQKMIRVYNMEIPGGQECDLQASRCGHLLVVIKGTVFSVPDKRSIQAVKQLKTGQYFWIPPRSTAYISANSDAECVLLELK